MLRLIFLFILASCVGGEKQEVTSGGAANPLAPSRWSLNRFPKTMKISGSFTPQERAVIRSGGLTWNTAMSGAVTFLAISGNDEDTVTDRANVNNLDSLLDGVFAVYKGSTWHRDLPSTALAVTQIFGVRQNRGDADEYVEIVEGDILINWTFPFKPTDITGYDLYSVVMHEYGHFLGLSHTTNWGNDSVMFPSIDKATTFPAPGSLDVNNLRVKYSINGGALSARSRTMTLPKEATREDVLNSGRGVRILLELHANGECIHKINGTRVESHFVKLK